MRRALYDPPGAIAAGLCWLEAEAARGFPDAAHAIRFPRHRGFHADPPEQVSDVFTRAVIGGALLDALDALGDEALPGARALARAQWAHAWASALPGLGGRFAYFQGLRELPPDADSLAAVLSLTARLCPERLPELQGPLRLVEAGVEARGALPTWLIDEGDPPDRREAFERGVRDYWGDGLDVGVNARLLFALGAAGLAGSPWVRRAIPPLLAAQGPGGMWRATWYVGEILPTCMALDGLRAAGVEDGRVGAAEAALWRRQRPNGGFGEGRSDALPTGAALYTLAQVATAEDAPRLERAAACLLGQQERSGAFDKSLWMKMDIGRAWGRVIRTMAFGCDSLSTAMALRGLAAFEAWRTGRRGPGHPPVLEM